MFSAFKNKESDFLSVGPVLSDCVAYQTYCRYTFMRYEHCLIDHHLSYIHLVGLA